MKNKIIAIALALTTLAWVAPVVPVGAATVEELQAQINALLQQIAQLQTQLSGQSGSTTPAVTGCFTKYLVKEVTDPEVTTLQTVLKSDPMVYPEGLVTGYFGSLTEAAVKKFQAKYGIDQTGTVGPVTRAKLNSLYCVTTPTVTPTVTPTTIPTVSVTPTTSGVPSYGTLSVQPNPVSQSESTLEAGKTYELVAAQYKASGSDITIKKIVVKTTVTNKKVFPWQIFSAISLWDGSTKLAEVAINSANLIEDKFAEEYTLNIAGLNIVVPNSQNKVLTVKGTTLGYFVENAKSASIEVALPGTGIVFTDTAGIVYTSTNNSPDRTVTTSGSESNRATIKLSLASDNPKEGAVVGSKSSSSKVDLVKFNTKVENVGFTMNKMEIEIGAAAGTSTLTAIELHDASGLIASASVTTTDVTLESFTLPIAAETTKTFTIKGVLASLGNDYAGTEAYKVNTVKVYGVDANNNLPSDTPTLPTSGNYQHVYLVAPQFTLVSNPTPVKNENGNAADTTLSFDVKALGGDIYFSAVSSTFVKDYSFDGASTSASSTFVMDVTGYTEKNDFSKYYRVAENATARVSLSIHLLGGENYAQFKIKQLDWGTSSSVSAFSSTTYGLDDFKTPNIYLSK